MLPLDDRMIELFGARFRPNVAAPADRRYVYRPPMSPIPGQAAAAIGGRSFDLTARVTRTPGDEGVLFATGTENSGISVFVQNDRLVVDYNAFDDHTILESVGRRSRPGESTLVGAASAGRGSSDRHDGDRASTATPAGSADLPLFMRMISSVGAEHRPTTTARPCRTATGAVPVHRHAARGRRSNCCRARTSRPRAAEAAAEMSRQ